MSSGLPPAEDIDVTVLRRSVWLGGGLGGGVESTLADELLESHEKGPASFFWGGIVADDPD